MPKSPLSSQPLSKGSFVLLAADPPLKEYTLYRLLDVSATHCTIVEFEPNETSSLTALPSSSSLLTFEWTSPRLALPQPFWHYSRAPTFALAPLSLPSSSSSSSSLSLSNGPDTDREREREREMETTSVYYSCTVPQLKERRLAHRMPIAGKEREVRWTEGGADVVPLSVTWPHGQRVACLIQPAPISKEVVASTLLHWKEKDDKDNTNDKDNDGMEIRRSEEPLVTTASTSPLASPLTSPSPPSQTAAANIVRASVVGQAAQPSTAVEAKSKKRKWWLPLPHIASSENKQQERAYFVELSEEEKDGHLHRQFSTSASETEHGYIDLLGCWHAWDAVKALPSRKLVVAAYAPQLTFS